MSNHPDLPSAAASREAGSASHFFPTGSSGVEGAASAPGPAWSRSLVSLQERWGEPIEPREAGFGGEGMAPATPATLEDRRDGRCLPLYETETDLARQRGAARRLALLTPVALGALDSLANYVFGSGFTLRVEADDAPPAWRTAAQRVLDRLADDNDLAGLFDRELHHRVREDGEAFVQLVSHRRGACRLRFLEPEQITEPARPRPLEDWLGVSETLVSSWSFGVHTPAEDPTGPLGYHVVHDSAGRDWNYLPVDQVEHLRRNVPRNAKRGVSDFAVIQADLEREAVLRRNTAEGAALQAAIAWILQPQTSDQAPLGIPRSEVPVAHRATPVTTAYERVRRYPPGTILRPSAGLEYKPGPLGSERIPHFLQVGQAVLRSIGLRWSMPEYLISGDASNANYASTHVAESPFVKAREADQQYFRRHLQSLCWKVLRLAWRHGAFDHLGVPFDVLLDRLTIQIGVPAVASRDPRALAQTHELQLRLGLLSRRTAAAQAGLDFEQEQRNRVADLDPVWNTPFANPLSAPSEEPPPHDDATA